MLWASNQFGNQIPKVIKTVVVSGWVALSIRTASFYSFHIKTVRSPIENRTFSIWKPYGFEMENVKGRQPETDTESFNHTLIRICQANLAEKFKTISKLFFFSKIIHLSILTGIVIIYDFTTFINQVTFFAV